MNEDLQLLAELKAENDRQRFFVRRRSDVSETAIAFPSAPHEEALWERDRRLRDIARELDASEHTYPKLSQSEREAI